MATMAEVVDVVVSGAEDGADAVDAEVTAIEVEEVAAALDAA